MTLSRLAHPIARFTPLFILGLSITRLLYEAFFPTLAWIGMPLAAILFSAVFALLLSLHSSLLPPPSSLLPLLLNLLYLFNSEVNLTQSRLIFAASIWLTAVLHFTFHASRFTLKNHLLFLLIAIAPIYLLTMPATVGRADTFEFQVVVPNLGIVHPTGYPLYLLLGKLWTLLIPFGSVAWRLNVGTAVFALAALCLLYLISHKLTKHPLPALLGAIAFGLTPTFWSQAIEAEVYALHALVVAGALWLMVQTKREIGEWRLEIGLAALIGLGMTNHVTTIFLVPPAILFVICTYLPQRTQRAQRKEKNTNLPWWPSLSNLQSLIPNIPKLLLAFFTPLLFYLYLPLRWQAVNGEAMGFGRFLDWVVGGRFQGALQLSAWLHDPNRYEIIGRLFLDNWGWFNLCLILLGFCYLLYTNWQAALILFTTWLGFTFYALNYYVPDLAVFIIPAHLVMGMCWAVGGKGVLDSGCRILEHRISNTQYPISTLLFLPLLLLAVANWPTVDRSDEDGLTTWGLGVLQMPLAQGAAILADSEKIAPLYYLQQAEGLRPDLDIMVLPDEAAYRTELDSRLTAGQVVYLARFLPGLEGIYHLRSVGPLTEVSTQPMSELPENAIADGRRFGAIELVGYELETEAAIEPTETAVTFYWRTSQPLTQTLHIYTRWQGSPATSQHPANNYYPTPAWKVGEIVSDFHLLPHPISPITQTWQLQVAFAPPFSAAETLTWQTVTNVELPPTAIRTLERPFRAQLGSTWLAGAQFPAQIRPQTPLPVLLTGYGQPEGLVISYQPSAVSRQPLANFQSPISNLQSPFVYQLELNSEAENGRYSLLIASPTGKAFCGWFAQATTSCILGEVEVSGVPLPENATNFEDKIALLDVHIPNSQLQPGGQLDVTLTWQSLAPLNENYTVFVQVLDANDKLVGQVDAWPRQGTHPTNQWQPGELVQDPYTVQLAADLQPGSYRLLVGWYLLGTLQRLQVVDGAGTAVNDKLEIPGLAYTP